MPYDLDLDFNLSPSGVIYGARFIMFDSTTQDGCFVGTNNAMCIGVTPQQTEFAVGQFGNSAPPFILGQPNDPNFPPGSQPRIPVYGPGRNALVDIDPAYGGQIAPNNLLISSTLGYGTKASPYGPWNQWICGIARTFANGGQSCNVKIVIFPWSPTGS